MSDVLEKLYDVLVERKDAAPDSSYVASLYNKGTGKICEKIEEEAREVIEEVLNVSAVDRDRLASESADLIFHLMVLWAEQGLAPHDVLSVLEKRFGVSGHEEKAAR